MYKLTDSEERFAEIIWKNAPLGSGQLVELCRQELGWKKSTTYTVLKKRCNEELFINDKAVLTALIGREAYPAGQSIRFVEERFKGSLPDFLTAFVSRRKLTKTQAEELIRLIDEHGED